MENETKSKRPCIHTYCDQATKEAVENHEMLDNCAIGQEKAHRILEALDFMAKWKDRVAELEAGVAPEQESRIAELEQQIETIKAEKEEAINSLQMAIEQERQGAASTQEGNEKLAAEINDLQLKLQEANDRAAVIAAEEVTWTKIASALDPAYVAVLEEITKRLKARFKLENLEPHVVLITFFMQYYYNQEVQFSGMPFVIKPKEILEIVQTVYPEMLSKTLKQALSVK